MYAFRKKLPISFLYFPYISVTFRIPDFNVDIGHVLTDLLGGVNPLIPHDHNERDDVETNRHLTDGVLC